MLRRSRRVPTAPRYKMFVGRFSAVCCCQPLPEAHVEDPDVAIHQQLKRILDLVHAIELRRALGAEALKPGWIDEIGQQDVVDLIAEAIILAGVADFVGVENSSSVAVLDEHGQVDVGVAQHFQQFVAGGDGPGRARLQVAGGEDLADGKSLGGEVVVTQSVSLVGVVEQNQPPASGGRLGCPWGRW